MVFGTSFQVYQYFTIYRWYFLSKFEQFSWISYTCTTLFKIRKYQKPFYADKSTWYRPLLKGLTLTSKVVEYDILTNCYCSYTPSGGENLPSTSTCTLGLSPPTWRWVECPVDLQYITNHYKNTSTCTGNMLGAWLLWNALCQGAL
jgi:hypothetical protein